MCNLVGIPIMKNWQLNNISFFHEYLGGYRLMDKAGELLYRGEDMLGYLPRDSQNAKSIVMKNAAISATVECNSESFRLEMQDDACRKHDAVVDEFTKWQCNIFELIAPASLEKTICQMVYYLPKNSEREVNDILLKLENPVLKRLSIELHSPSLSQSMVLMFKDGSFTTHVNVEGYSLAPTTPPKMVNRFYQTEHQRKKVEIFNSVKLPQAGNNYQWAVRLYVTVMEESPVTPTESNGWNHSAFSELLRMAEAAFSVMAKEFEK